MLSFRNICFIVSLGLISGCETVSDMSDEFFSGKDNAEPPAPLVDINTTVNVQRIWSANIGAGAKKKYLKLAALADYGKIFTASADGRVSARDAASGSTIWDIDTRLAISGGPGSGDEKIYVGTSNAEVMALDENTGKVLWTSKVSTEVLASPRSDDGIVIVRTIDGKLTGLDSDTGKQVWITQRSVPVLSLRGMSSPVIYRGVAFIGFSDGKVSAIEIKSGKTLWTARVAVPRGRSELERIVDIDSDPLVDDQVVHAVTFQGKIATIASATGKVYWRKDMSSHAGISKDNKYLYVSDDQSYVWSLDRRSSASLWRQTKLKARKVTAPASFGPYVVVGDLEGYLHWMSKEDGRFVARVRVDDSAIIAPPIVEGDILYVVSEAGTLAAYKAR